MYNNFDDVPWYMWILLIVFLINLAFDTAKAQDPNLEMPCTNLPTQENVKDLKAIFKEIRTIAAHPEMNYIRLHDKERHIILKKLPYQPELELFLK